MDDMKSTLAHVTFDDPLNAIETTEAYNRLFNYLSQIKNPETRNAALTDLNAVYGMTADALKASDDALRIAQSLKGMLDEAIFQRDMAHRQLQAEREAAANERELRVAEAVCNFFMLDKRYATALLDVLQGYSDEYDVDGFVLDEVRDAFLTLEMDMRDADECNAWLNDDNEAQAS